MGLDSQLQKILDENSLKYPSPEAEIPSSVLVLIGKNGASGGDEFVLTKRTLTVLTHKGQVSFPGGYREPEDKDLSETALRESHEEIGLERSAVKIVGMLEPVRAKGVFVAPFVGFMDLPYPFTLNPNEVHKLLFLPVTRLLSEGLVTHEIKEAGFQFKSPGIYIGEDIVWGATAKMLEQVRNLILQIS